MIEAGKSVMIWFKEVSNALKIKRMFLMILIITTVILTGCGGVECWSDNNNGINYACNDGSFGAAFTSDWYYDGGSRYCSDNETHVIQVEALIKEIIRRNGNYAFMSEVCYNSTN